ncbi:MAG: phosphatase PAP2 family protein [Deltaproteobacteria bacterium]|nr:phosphatase PAP2 family protein [Deltaproteobacteria bacterium]
MKKRWIALLIVTAGIVLCLIAYIRWDIPVAFYCHALNRSVIDIAEMITTAGESKWYFMLFVPLFLIFRVVLKNKDRAMKILFLIIALSASGLVSTLIKWIAGRSRPIELFNRKAFGFNFFEVGYELNSFPSGHAVTVFSLAAALYILFPRFGILAFIPAVAIALSRVVITSHYVSDVIGGAVVGTVCTLIVKYYFDRFGVRLPKPPSGDAQ